MKEKDPGLKKTFPNLYKTLTVKTVAGSALLYTCKEANPSLKLVLLMAHQVMVLVAPGTASRWTEPPFSGVIADGFVCGRGSIDDKGTLLSILDAVEMPKKEGFHPRRTLRVGRIATRRRRHESQADRRLLLPRAARRSSLFCTRAEDYAQA